MSATETSRNHNNTFPSIALALTVLAILILCFLQCDGQTDRNPVLIGTYVVIGTQSSDSPLSELRLDSSGIFELRSRSITISAEVEADTSFSKLYDALYKGSWRYADSLLIVSYTHSSAIDKPNLQRERIATESDTFKVKFQEIPRKQAILTGRTGEFVQISGIDAKTGKHWLITY